MINRIKLNQAMFPNWAFTTNIGGDSIMIHEDDREGKSTKAAPDPFTFAADDYAVLQWVRTDAVDWDEFVHALPYQNLWHFVQEHKIGDYARAALKVIE